MAKRGDKTVDVERENAELRRQLDESLAQQQATAEVLQVINSSPGDLAPVFDTILGKAHSLCGADFGSLVSFDGEFLRSAAERNLPPAWADFVRGPTPLGGPDHPATRLMRGEPFLHIEDLAELARTATDPMPRAGVELAGIRTLLLEGGGQINGAFLQADLVDEVSLLLVRGIDGRSDIPTVFYGVNLTTNTAVRSNSNR